MRKSYPQLLTQWERGRTVRGRLSWGLGWGKTSHFFEDRIIHTHTHTNTYNTYTRILYTRHYSCASGSMIIAVPAWSFGMLTTQENRLPNVFLSHISLCKRCKTNQRNTNAWCGLRASFKNDNKSITNHIKKNLKVLLLAYLFAIV